MGFFQQIEGEAAVIVERGVYRQVDVYQRDGYLYAKFGSGFVRLYADGSTTKAHCRLDTLSFEGALYKDALGRLCGSPMAGAKKLDAPAHQRLLGLAAPEAG